MTPSGRLQGGYRGTRQADAPASPRPRSEVTSAGLARRRDARRRRPGTSAGFTLLELLVVVAIGALLAMLVWSGYEDQIRASRRGEARRVLVEATLAMEQNFTVAGRFDRDGTGTPVSDGVVPRSPPFPAGLLTAGEALGSVVAYDIRFREPPAADSFTLVAVRRPGGPMATDACGDLALDQAGHRSLIAAASGVTAGDCWLRGRP